MRDQLWISVETSLIQCLFLSLSLDVLRTLSFPTTSSVSGFELREKRHYNMQIMKLRKNFVGHVKSQKLQVYSYTFATCLIVMVLMGSHNFFCCVDQLAGTSWPLVPLPSIREWAENKESAITCKNECKSNREWVSDPDRQVNWNRGKNDRSSLALSFPKNCSFSLSFPKLQVQLSSKLVLFSFFRLSFFFLPCLEELFSKHTWQPFLSA